jgi:hypothetical protein
MSPYWIRLRQPHGNALPRDGVAQPGLLHASASSFLPGRCAAAVDVSCGGLRPNCVSLYARAACVACVGASSRKLFGGFCRWWAASMVAGRAFPRDASLLAMACTLGVYYIYRCVVHVSLAAMTVERVSRTQCAYLPRLILPAHLWAFYAKCVAA